jgi:two-component system cell cycle response regulator DivK
MDSATVLIAEDHVDTREGYELYLRDSGFQVQSARTGLDVLDLLTGSLPDILVMDMGLPILDGWETTRRVRESWPASALPIIALTGYATANDRDRALQLGCNAFLAKPCSPVELLQKIGATLGSTWSDRIERKFERQANHLQQADLISETRRLNARVAASLMEMERQRKELSGALRDLKALAKLNLPPTPEKD